jgi:phage-related baseplate assembly protein
VVTRTYERPSPTIPGQADLFLATAAGPADAATVAAVNAFIKPRIPLTSTLSVASASPVTVTAKARLFIRSGYEQLALAQASSNLNAYLLSVSIGGTVYLSDLIAALQQPAGVRNVVLDSPTADVVLGETQVATVVQDLTVVPV